MASTTADRRFGVSTGVAIKAPVRAATTANITLSGEQTIDGVAIVTNDRVLVKNQTSAVENGIYVASTGSWTRDIDFNGSRDVVTGTRVFINEGGQSAQVWAVDTDGDISPGTTSISFVISIADLSEIIRIPTIAAMKLLTPVNKQRYYLDASTTEGDGSAAIYRGVTGAAAATYVNNDDDIIVPTGGDGSAAFILESNYLPDAVDPVAKPVREALRQTNQVWGTEHFSAVRKLMLSTSAFTVIFSGDSTTVGNYNAWPGPVVTPLPTAYKIDQLVADCMLNRGIVGGTYTNAGHGGDTTNDWVTTHLAVDIAAAPDLYVWRWGINDKSAGRTAAQFNTDLRAGLTTLRAAYDDTVTSVVLMVPNAIYDTSTGRTASWIEEIRPYIKQAALDFKCAYIDTDGILNDAINSSDYMDKDPITGKAIHPLEVQNVAISSIIVDALLPTAMGIIAKNNYTETNDSAASTDLASTYPDGVSAKFANGAGWAHTGGTVVTHKHRAGEIVQYNIGSAMINNRSIISRRTAVADVWGDWSYANITPSVQNGWTLHGTHPFSVSIRDNVAHFSGAIVPGTTTPATVMATLSGVTFVKSVFVNVVDDGAYGTGADISITTGGSIQIRSGGVGNLWLNFSIDLTVV